MIEDASARQREILFRIHRDIPREGPGDAASTRRAYSMLQGMAAQPRILDVGCGPGLQTIQLAQQAGGQVVGLDVHGEYLRQLNKSALAAGLQARIHAVQGSMSSMPFPDRLFDAIWAEGSIYIVGFEEGLIGWKRMLRPRGCIAATHLSWLTTGPAGAAADIPDVPKAFWTEKYPAIATITENLAIADACGYDAIGHFTLPESAWWTDYYEPLERRLADIRRDPHIAEDAVAQAAMAGTQAEIDLYRRYADVYGYVFYVLRLR
jgi:SAM-dependent methyltransferase